MLTIELTQLATSMGVKSEDLDDEVHDVASKVASDVNNGGMESQIEYLVRNGYSTQDILQVFEEVKS